MCKGVNVSMGTLDHGRWELVGEPLSQPLRGALRGAQLVAVPGTHSATSLMTHRQMNSSSCPVLLSLVPVSGPDPQKVPLHKPLSQAQADPKVFETFLGFCQFRATRITNKEHAVNQLTVRAPCSFVRSFIHLTSQVASSFRTGVTLALILSLW